LLWLFNNYRLRLWLNNYRLWRWLNDNWLWLRLLLDELNLLLMQLLWMQSNRDCILNRGNNLFLVNWIRWPISYFSSDHSIKSFRSRGVCNNPEGTVWFYNGIFSLNIVTISSFELVFGVSGYPIIDSIGVTVSGESIWGLHLDKIGRSKGHRNVTTGNRCSQ
jgi:hypothetical protein